jgi:glucose-6-phosphate dehydrogenase assembly protein OpcA
MDGHIVPNTNGKSIELKNEASHNHTCAIIRTGMGYMKKSRIVFYHKKGE